MNKSLYILPLALLITAPHAQQGKNRVGIVNVQAVVKAMPNNKTYLDLFSRVDADLKAKQKNIQALTTRAQAARTTANLQALAKAQREYVNAQTSHQQRLAQAFQPLAGKVNAAVARAAKANGYSVVLDQQVAAQTNLVVYANASVTDLTNAVIKNLK